MNEQVKKFLKRAQRLEEAKLVVEQFERELARAKVEAYKALNDHVDNGGSGAFEGAQFAQALPDYMVEYLKEKK
jgi:hypothetical protein